MTQTAPIKDAADMVARDVARQRTSQVAARLVEPAEQFKTQAAEQIEDLAGRIRRLGTQLERDSDAHRVARRLERTADYLRYRPAPQVAGDAWDTVRQSPAVWIGGGLAAGLAVYFAVRRSRRQHD